MAGGKGTKAISNQKMCLIELKLKSKTISSKKSKVSLTDFVKK